MSCRHKKAEVVGGATWCPDCGALSRGGKWTTPTRATALKRCRKALSDLLKTDAPAFRGVLRTRVPLGNSWEKLLDHPDLIIQPATLWDETPGITGLGVVNTVVQVMSGAVLAVDHDRYEPKSVVIRRRADLE